MAYGVDKKMLVLIRTQAPLSNDALIKQLHELRPHCLTDSSHFAVAAILEFHLSDHDYAYVSGVNVENTEHNRLSLHAEQNAIATALTLLGPTMRFTKAWIMGAPINTPLGNHELVNKAVTACGHCRQILLDLAANNAKIYSVTLNGAVTTPLNITDLLPHAFSQDNLGLVSRQQNDLPSSDIAALLTATDLNHADLYTYLRAIKPRIISTQFQTSVITACILKTTSGHYIPGALIQDVAFLTTDAIFTAIGLAITQLGHTLELDAVYLYGDTAQPASLTGAEIDLLKRFSNGKTHIEYFTSEGNTICLGY